MMNTCGFTTECNCKQTGGLPVTMDFYQVNAGKTAIYPDKGSNLTYPVLGLTNEAGEVAGKLKKAMRDGGGEITADRRDALMAELGDVLWYLAACCTELGISLGDVASANLYKLAARERRGTLGGDGDKR